MKMTKVESSTIIAIGYDNKKLEIQFKNGTYRYSDVEKEVYDNLLKSESKGKYFYKNIKGKYRFERI